jgi:hypothetical protein
MVPGSADYIKTQWKALKTLKNGLKTQKILEFETF